MQRSFPRSTSRASRVASVAAALVLAATAAVTPAHAEGGSDTSADEPSSSFSFDDLPAERSSADAFPEPSDLPHGVVELESTPTVKEGTTSAARKPQVTKRSARLWLSRTVDFWPPDEQDVNTVQVDQDVKAKRIVIDADYSAPPTASLNSLVLVYFGKWNGQTCSGQVMGAAAAHDSSSAGIFWDMKGNSVGTATRSLSGSNLKITLTGNAAGNQGYDCVYAYVDEIVS